MRATSTESSQEIADSFRALLRSKVLLRPSDDHFQCDWEPLWVELREGGWVEMGRQLVDSGGYAETLLDLIPISEVWGEHLVPLPFSEALLLLAEDVDSGLVGALTNESTVWISFSDRQLPTLQNPSILREDDFAPSRLLREYEIAGLSLPPRANESIATLWAAEGVGAAQSALSRAVEYSNMRVAYDRPIGSFQAVKHLLADMLVHLQLARSGALLSVHEPERRWEIAGDSLARSRKTVQSAIQVFGGIGFTWETGVHFYLRHILILEKLVRLGSRASWQSPGAAA
jgi:hypothetical protein